MDSGSGDLSVPYPSLSINKKTTWKEKSKGLPKPQPEMIQHAYSHLFFIALSELGVNFWVLSNKYPQWIRLLGTHLGGP